MAETRVDVVNHVHWDREWYLPFERFRARLVELVDAVADRLEDGRYRHFLLDGQTIAVHDHLDVRPGDRDRLTSLARDGRLAVGPWCTLADMTLVGGEALVRNLLHGRSDAEALGATMDVGYCPDMFGHPPDLPRVLAGFDIATALVWRGTPEAPTAFRWRSPDGAQVLALRSRYYEPEVLWEPDAAAQRLGAWIADQQERQPDGPLLLLNGGDHMLPTPPGPDGDGTLSGEVVWEDVDLPTHVRRRRDALVLDDLPVVEGELRAAGRAGAFLLAGTLSTRVDLKQANNRCEDLLERWVEPWLVTRRLAAAAPSGAAVAGLEDLAGRAWRLLLANQAHDSICGTSRDDVHAANLAVFRRVADLAEHVLDRCWRGVGLDTALPRPLPDETAWFVVASGHGGRGREGFTVELLVAPGMAPVEVVDHHGRVVAFAAEDLGPVTAFDTDVTVLPTTPPAHAWRLRCIATDVPPHGWAAWQVRLGDDLPDAATATVTAASELVDGPWQLGVGPDGELVGSVDGRPLAGLRLVDVGDRGDTYTHEPVGGPVVGAEVRRSEVVRTAVDQRLVWEAAMTVPRRLDPSRQRRGDEQAELAVRVEVAMWRGGDELHWTVEVDNTAEDHRFAVAFDLDPATASWTTGAAFTRVERPVADRLPDPVTAVGDEQAVLTAPLHTWCAAGDGPARLALLSRDVAEVQADRLGGRPVLALTLLRCIGWLGRRDLTTRRLGAGPDLPTPDAQLPGRHRFTGVLRVGDDDVSLAAAADRVRGGLRARQVASRPDAASAPGPFRLDGPLLLSAVRPSHDGRDVVVRVVNPTPSPATGTLHTTGPPTAVHHSDLDERVGGPAATGRDGSVELALGPHEQRTLRLSS